MIFAQLIEYNMRNIFLEKPYTNVDGKLDSFINKSKLNISLDQHQQSEIF